MDFFKHETALVDEGAQIGQNSCVWHWTHVCERAKIGSDCSLGQNVFIGNDVVIGNHVKIQNNVSVYEGVILEDGVFCGPSMVFTNVYNPRARINRKKEYKKTWIKKGATLGANCTIVCGIEIGAYAFIGAGSVVNRHVADYALVVGVPARQIAWMNEYGQRLDLPLTGNVETICPHTQQRYRLNGNKVVRLLEVSHRMGVHDVIP